jgi:hypothetical protein
MHKGTKLSVGLIVLALAQLALVNRSAAWCLWNCEPTEDNARTVLENRMQSFMLPGTSFTILQFQKTNGASSTMPPGYQIYFNAAIDLPGGTVSIDFANDSGFFFRHPYNFIKEGEKAPVAGTKTDTVIGINSSFFFQQTDRGWLGEDGRIY